MTPTGADGPSKGEQDNPYVGRGGLKLRHAIDAFGLDVTGLRCADFGCNLGGFTDCLLRAGAARVWAVDTGYGMLDYKLRIDPRVVVMERTSALHAEPPSEAEGGAVDLIVIDMGWTTLKHCVPAALRWLRQEESARIITLVKPHYEASGGAGRGGSLEAGVLDEPEAERVVRQTLEAMPALGALVLGVTKSPVVGGAGKKNKRGNIEYLALLRRA